LRQAEGKVDKSFLVVSGDNIIDPDTISHLLNERSTTILVKEQDNVSKYGVVEVQGQSVVDIMEKPMEALSHLVNTGIYVFGGDIFDYIEQETDIPSVLRNMISAGQEVKACEATGSWLDVVYPWDMLKLNDVALGRAKPVTGGIIEAGVDIKGSVSVGKGSIIRSNSYIVGPAIIGENCEIGPSVCILPSTSIGDNVCISPFSVVTNCIIADGVEIGPSSTLQDTIMDRGCLAKGHLVTQSGEAEVKIESEHHQVRIGAIIGERCEIGDSVVTAPGIIVGNRCRIRPLKVLEGNIPDESLVV
jgi:glucose-1-phosphate thymidylyltransferase